MDLFVVRLRSGAGGMPWRWRTVANRLIGDMISQVGERPENPIIAPGSIFLGYPHNQVLDFFVDWRSTHASLCS